jgi:hypothetical protein
MPAAPEYRLLPTWLVWLVSAAIVFHFFALLIAVAAVESGPWPTPMGQSTAFPPAFAQEISDRITPPYLQPLQLSLSNYHFESNRTDYDAVYFEAQLHDSQGQLIKTVRLPQEGANFWVWNRQVLLAQKLGLDDPVAPPRGEAIPAPGKEPRMVMIWDSPRGEPPMQLRRVSEYLIARDRPVFKPSDLSLDLARSYSRYLCREYGAASVELVRHSRRPIFPTALLAPEPAPDAFEELICSFGDYPLEKQPLGSAAR